MTGSQNDLLARIDERVNEILRRMETTDRSLAQYRDGIEKQLSTLDTRIGALEQFRWWFLGVAAAVGVFFSLAKEWFFKRGGG